MENRLLAARKLTDFVNLGDYVQAVAANQYLGNCAGFIDRDDIGSYSGAPARVVMNGWFMLDCSQWPPSDNIVPLFVSFHLTREAAAKVLSGKGGEYLKKFQPIGCRDYQTLKWVTEHNIEGYFTGCLTLTLGRKYKSDERDGRCIMVDPPVPAPRGFVTLLGDAVTLLCRLSSFKKLSDKLFHTKSNIKNLLKAVRFHRVYSEILEPSTIMDAVYLTHHITKKDLEGMDDWALLHLAEERVKMYSKASLVVTSRIHCALPSLGLETPVVFIYEKDTKVCDSDRYGGLKELFNSVSFTDKHLCPDFNLTHKLSEKSPLQNPDGWRPLAKNLADRCHQFFSGEQKAD